MDTSARSSVLPAKVQEAKPTMLHQLPSDVCTRILSLLPRSAWPSLRQVSRSFRAAVDSEDILLERRASHTQEPWLYAIGQSNGRQRLLALDLTATRGGAAGSGRQGRWYTLGQLPSYALLARSTEGTLKKRPLHGFAVAAIGPQLFILGGSRAPPPPQADPRGVCDLVQPPVAAAAAAAAAQHQQKLRLAAALSFRQRLEHRLQEGAEVWAFDCHVSQWRAAAPMLAPSRVAFAAGVLGGRIYVAGGTTHAGEPLASAEVYVPECDMWQPLPPLPKAGACTGVVVGDRFHVLALDGEGCIVVRGVYDPAAATWQPLALSPAAPSVTGEDHGGGGGGGGGGVPAGGGLRIQAVEAGGEVFVTRCAPEGLQGPADRQLRRLELREGGTWRACATMPPGGAPPLGGREREVMRQPFSVAAAGGRLFVIGGVAWARLFGLHDYLSIPVFNPRAGTEAQAWEAVGQYEDELFLGAVSNSIAVSI